MRVKAWRWKKNQGSPFLVLREDRKSWKFQGYENNQDWAHSGWYGYKLHIRSGRNLLNPESNRSLSPVQIRTLAQLKPVAKTCHTELRFPSYINIILNCQWPPSFKSWSCMILSGAPFLHRGGLRVSNLILFTVKIYHFPGSIFMLSNIQEFTTILYIPMYDK